MTIRDNELILYRYFPDDIFRKMAQAAKSADGCPGQKEQLVDDIYTCLHEMVTI